MSYPWYEEVPATAALMQGDLLCNCPVVRWSYEPQPEQQQAHDLEQMLVGEAVDCIVMSQACDLEQGHIRDVIVCPTYTVTEYRAMWRSEMTARGQNPTDKSWSKFLDDISDGVKWNLAMINGRTGGEGRNVTSEIRVVDFHEILSLPRVFVESWTMRAAISRLRLLPPYREHLSQAFARYFMRVGLPLNIERVW